MGLTGAGSHFQNCLAVEVLKDLLYKSIELYLDDGIVYAENECENDEELIALLNSKIRTLPGVTSTESFVYLKVAKQVYNWGTR